MKVSACIMTLNEAEHITGLLDNLLGRVDETIIVDGGSSDSTVDQAIEFTNKVYVRPSRGWPEPDRDFAMRQSRNSWVLFMDADELASPFLLEALSFLTNRNVSGYRIPRRNYYDHANGKYYRHIHYPDYQLRLFNKTKARWPEGLHSCPEIDGECINLFEPYHIKHLRPIYSNPAKYREWVKIQARSRPIHYHPLLYRACAPLRYMETFGRDLAGGCLLDGLRGLKAAHDHALYDYWEYDQIGRCRRASPV